MQPVEARGAGPAPAARLAQADDRAYLASLPALKREFARRGFYERATGRLLLELLLHVTLYLGGIAVFVASQTLWIQAAGLLLSTAGSLGVMTNTHTSSHDGTARSTRLNAYLTYFGYTLLLGVSATWWWNKHVIVHHPNPNIVGVDDDIDLNPFFAVTERDLEGAGGLRRLLARVQWVALPFALFLNAPNVIRQGVVFLAGRLLDGRRRERSHWIDLGFLTLHGVAWVGVPLLFFHPLDVLGFHVLRLGFQGYALFVAFAPAHFPAEAACTTADQRGAPFALKQTWGTVDFRTGSIGRLFCSGVEYQIEHHLDCSVSHTHYPAMSGLVREFCAHHGYPYRTLGWGEALWKSVKVFREPKRVEPSLAGAAGGAGA